MRVSISAREQRACGPALLRAGLGHQDDELIAAVAEAVVLLAAQFLQALAGAGEQFAAHEVAVRVVDQLELVEIDKGQAEGTARAAGAPVARPSTS